MEGFAIGKVFAASDLKAADCRVVSGSAVGAIGERYSVALNGNVYTCAASSTHTNHFFRLSRGANRFHEAEEPTYEKTVSSSPLFAGDNCIDRLLHTGLGTGQHSYGSVR